MYISHKTCPHIPVLGSFFFFVSRWQGYNWKKILTESLPNKLADFDPQASRLCWSRLLGFVNNGPNGSKWCRSYIGHDDRVKRDDAEFWKSLSPICCSYMCFEHWPNGGLRPGFPIAVNPQQEIAICYCIYTYMHIHAYIYIYIRVYMYVSIFVYIIYIYMHIRIGNHTVFNIVGWQQTKHVFFFVNWCWMLI